MRRAAVILFAAIALTSLAGCSASTDPYDDPQSLVGSDGSSVSTPTPTPAPPVTHPVADLSTLSGAAASALLTSENIKVVVKSSDGSALTDTTGLTFQRQDPVTGTQVAEGSTVTVTFAPPPPPPPAPVPAPATAPGGGATAKCVDGSLSFAAHRQGTCSHHGGVAIWY